MAHWTFRHKDNVKDSNSPFVSFSVSLLTTLQRAEWLKQHRHEDIYIFVIYTQYLKETDLVISLYTLLKAFGTSEQRPFIVQDAADEFLYSTLGNEGLYRLVPELRNCGAALGACLADLRENLFNSDGSGAFTSMNAKQHLGVSSTLRNALYPQSIDTFIAFLCLRAHGRYGDGELLKRSVVAMLEGRIYRRYFEEDGSIHYRSATSYSWLETYSSGSGNEDMRIYELMHRYLTQQARDYEDTTTAIAADRVEASLRARPCEVLQGKDTIEDSLRRVTGSFPYNTVTGILADVEDFHKFNDHFQQCQPRQVFEDYVIGIAGQSLRKMNKLISVCRALM